MSGIISRANKTVFIFAYVYLGIGAAAFVSYLLAGMSPLDAVCHAMSVCATGGFSSRNLSIAAFDSTLIEGITILFMYLSSIHFGVIFLCFVNRSFKPLNNPILKFYTLCLLVFALLTGFSLKISGVEPSLGRALWEGTFQTVSIASTTGFAIADNASWPLCSNLLLMFMAVMCGCAGSTSGGVKADRVLVLLKSTARQIGRILHPSSINEVRLGNRVIREDVVAPQVLPRIGR